MPELAVKAVTAPSHPVYHTFLQIFCYKYMTNPHNSDLPPPAAPIKQQSLRPEVRTGGSVIRLFFHCAEHQAQLSVLPLVNAVGPQESGQLKAVKVHHLVPGGYKVLDELFL